MKSLNEIPQTLEHFMQKYIDYEKDECVITLNPQKFYKDEDLKAYKPMYESNGWKWSG